MELVYSLPASIKGAGLSTISVELPYESAYSLWSRVEQLETPEDKRKGEYMHWGIIFIVVDCESNLLSVAR